MRVRWVLALIGALAPVTVTGTEILSQGDVALLSAAEIVFLGEIHDNPHHHKTQAALTERLDPSALVFEMLTPAQARAVTPENRSDANALEAALGWAASGWPDFAMYHPIFTAAPNARIYGAAVPREATRAAMGTGIAGAFGAQAPVYGLTDPLPPAQQAAREQLQHEAHCAALPEELLPTMVEIQRLRDARLAQEALRALDETGGPVIVITGNGHARADWGAPSIALRARHDLKVAVVGQSEDGVPPQGRFDLLIDAPSVDRPDPCAAFSN